MKFIYSYARNGDDAPHKGHLVDHVAADRCRIDEVRLYARQDGLRRNSSIARRAGSDVGQNM